ncbi:hypothetical protein PRNP1_001249 [Phytophthora ramorum]
MGASQSLDAFFGSPNLQSDSEQADVYQYLRRVEKTLWLTGPWWEHGSDVLEIEAADDKAHSPSKRSSAPRDPFKKLTPHEALVIIPTLLDDMWVSPLVALIDSVDPIARSAGLALLSRIVQRESVAKVFLAVKGMHKVMDLLDSQDRQATHLALEIVFALCAGSPSVILPCCQAGLIPRLTELTKSEHLELVLASLKVLRLTLQQTAVKVELSACKLLSVLMDLVHSQQTAIAKTAIMCIGLSLPNAENLAEILRLGCIDIFLRLMTPSNPNVDAVIFALSLIADETDTIFPREQTTTALSRMLETLRGAAKRSAAASATSFLFASLAKSSIFHAAICTETNLGILAKLLVGGSPEVLGSTAYALGIVAIHANDRVRQILFQVDGPQSLMQLVILSLASTGLRLDENVASLAIFALAAVTSESLVLRAGALVHPELLSETPEPLRVTTIATCEDMQGSDFLPHVYARAITRFGAGSTYALKLLAALSTASHVKERMCEAGSVSRMLEYLRGASAVFLPSLLVLFLECCSCDRGCKCTGIAEDEPAPTLEDDVDVPGSSLSFCKLVETTPDALRIFGVLFQNHQPEHLLGLAPLLAALAAHSAQLREDMSSSKFFVDQALSVAMRLNLEALHEQVLGFLERLTARKNARALEQLFASDPDRIANLLQASLCTKVQLLAAILLRRLFKRLNSRDIPSRAAQRHLAKLLSASSVDLMVSVGACRVWGNLFQYEDKRIAFAQLSDSVPGLLQLLQRCIDSQPANDEHSIALIQTLAASTQALEAQEKRSVPPSLKPLYWVIRSTFRASCCEITKQSIVTAPHFLCIMTLFPHLCDPIARLAIDTMSELARSKTPGLRRTLAVPVVLNAIQHLLRDRDRASGGRGVLPQRHVLRFLGLLARKDAAIQHVVVQNRLMEALLLLLHSPSTALNPELLAEALDALAWVCSAVRSPTDVEAQAEIDDETETETPVEGEAPARRVVATPKMVDFALRHADSSLAPVARASLHLLQRLACEQPGVPRFVFDANGASVVMRALQHRPENAVQRRVCGLVRHLVYQHDGNRQQFQELGATSFLVELVTTAHADSEDQCVPRNLQIKGLQALAALCEGSGPATRAAKTELLECDQSAKLVRLVSVDDTNDERLCAAWARALAMGALASSTNQRRLVSAGIVPLLTKLLRHTSGRVRVPTAQLLAYLAEAPENRGTIMVEGGEALLSAVIAAMQSELPGLQRYTALFVAHATTRHEANKIRLGAAGAAAPLIDRLSSQRRHVLENVLLAVVKLGSHAGNKVKLGGKVCFEKLLALVHHEALGVAKGAARALAVLVVGNDANRKFLLQCEAPVVAELSALLKGSNGAIVESAMLVLGELAPMPAQALELSRYVDVLSVVKLLTHINPRISRASLLVIRHLTRESFNKTRFGLLECVEALLARLRVGLGGTSGADELEIVELTITCLANLSFASSNASRIAEARDQRGGSLLLLLQLAVSALSTPMKDYLSDKEVTRLMSQDEEMDVDAVSSSKNQQNDSTFVSTDNNDSWPVRGEQVEFDDEEMYESMARNSPRKGESGRGASPRSDEPGEAEIESQTQLLDFSAFPSLQTAVLEQTLLVLSNCTDHYRTAKVVDVLAVAVLCQALLHSSELVARCGCYTLACWLKDHHALQDAATRRGALQALSKLLTSTSLVVVEAAAYVLSKLAARGDNPIKLLALDVPATLVHSILRKPANVPHDRVLDRAVRLLGTLVQFSRVRQTLKGEEIIADVLTPLLQLHPQTLGKNLSRLVLALLADDSLKFFLPKKTVSLLRACFVHQATNAKTIRNVLHIFALLVTVEEHKTTITLEDSGEALGRMVQELQLGERVLGENDDTVLGLLACIAGTRRIAVILHENDVYARLPSYITVSSEESESLPSPIHHEIDAAAEKILRKRRLHTVQVATRLCKTLGEQAVRRLSDLEFTGLLLDLLRVGLPRLPPPEAEEDVEELHDTASPTPLSLLAWECIDVVRQLCPTAYDEQVIAEEGGVEVLVAYFELWFSVASGMAPALFPVEGGEALVLAFAVSLAMIIRILSAQMPNRELLVQAGGFSLVLKALGLGTPELPDPQREQLAEALAGLTALPIMIPYLEASPDLVAPLFRVLVAPQTQQQSRLLLLVLRAFADVMEVSPASRAYVLLITGGTIQPLPFLLSCLNCSNLSTSDDSILKMLHTMRSLQHLVTDEAVTRALSSLSDLPAIGKLLSLVLPDLPTYDDRLEMVQLMATETLGYMAFFGHAPRLRLERAAVSRLLAQINHAHDERVKPESIATSIWTLTLLAKPQIPSSLEAEAEKRAEIVTTATCVRAWMWGDAHGLDVLIGCGLRSPEYLKLPTSVTSDVLAVLTTATDQEPEAQTVLGHLVQKRVCTSVASLLEAVEPGIRRPALLLLARLLKMHSWALDEPLVNKFTGKEQGRVDTPLIGDNGHDDIPGERWSAILLHLAEWMQVFAQDPQSTSLSELRDAYSCLSVLTANSDLVARFQRGEEPRGLIDLVATALHHFSGRHLPSRPESLVLIRKESACNEEELNGGGIESAERARADWALQFDIVFHALRVCRRMMSFSLRLSDRALGLRVPRALDSLVMLHDRQILDEALRCMLHLTTLRGEETHLLFSSDRTVARLKGLLQSESRPLQARITPILALMAANMPTLPGLCGMDGILILADLAASSAASDILVQEGGDASLVLDRRVFEDSCTMLHVIFSHEEGVVLAFDVAQVVPKLFGIVEHMTARCIVSLENDASEAPKLLQLPLDVLVRVSAAPAAHVRYLELLPRICRLLDGDNGPAKRTGRWCEMLLSILFNVFGCPFGSSMAVCKASVETLAQGKRALLPQLLPLERWLSVVETFPALGRFVIELIRAFVGNGEPSSPYAALFNSGEDIPALLTLVGSQSDAVAIPSAQLLLTIIRQRGVRVALIVADGVAALVAALCLAKTIKVQNLLLALILDLSRGDTEVQALLLGAPGCVTRLVGFVQEWVDTHATTEKQENWDSLGKRLTLTCTLLTELSRALRGPERVVEANGHLPLLALSIQQQKDDDVQGAQTTVQILTNLAVAGMTVAPGLAASKLPAHFLSCVLTDEKVSAWLSKKHALPLKRRLALSGLLALAKADRELRSNLAKSEPLVVLLESLLQNSEEKANIKKGENSPTIARDALLLLYLMSTVGCADVANHSSPEILTRVCDIVRQHLVDDSLQDDGLAPVEVTRGLKLLANLLDTAHDQESEFAWHPEELLGLAPLLEARVAMHQTTKEQLPALRILRGAFSLTNTDKPKERFYFPLSPKLLAELLTVLLVSASRQHHDIAERIVVSAFQNDPERARESVGDNQILEQLLIVFTQSGSDAVQRASDLAVVLTQVLYVSIARGFIVSQRFLAKLLTLLASYAHEALLGETEGANQSLKKALSVYLSFLLLLLASTGHFIDEIKAAGVRKALENNPLISAEDKALPVALLGMLGYSADLNEEFARALAQFDGVEDETERQERVAYLLRFLERYSLTHAPTKEQAIDSFMTYLVADAEKAQAAAASTELAPEATDQLGFAIASDCLASLVKIAGWSPTPDPSLLQSSFGELYLARWDLNALLAVAFARQRGGEDNDFQERPRLSLAQIAQVLELAGLVRAQLDENVQASGAEVVAGQVDSRWLYNAFMLVNGHLSTCDTNTQPGCDDLRLVEQVLSLLHWLAVNSSDCFADLCRYAGLLRVFLVPLTPTLCGCEARINSENGIGDGAMELFLSLVDMTVNTPAPGSEATASVDEVLIDLLKFLYVQVDNGLREGALAHLCAFSLCLDALVRNATVPVLAQILFSPLVATPRRCEIEACVLALLGKMCARNQIVSRRIVSSNLLPKLCEFLVVEKPHQAYTQREPPAGEFSVHNNAVRIVCSLSKDPELVLKLVAHRILEILCDQLLAYEDITIQRKALGAMSHLVSAAEMDAELLQSVVAQVVENVRRNVPVPEAHRTVANALAVFVAIIKTGKNCHSIIQQHQQRRPQNQQQQRHNGESYEEVNARLLLLKGEGLRVTLDLLGAADLHVKLEAFRVVSEYVEDHPDPDGVRELLLGSEEQGGSHALLSLVRAISDEARSMAAAVLPSMHTRGKNDLLLVVMTFLNMLLADEILKTKLTPTTYDVVLQVVVATSATTIQQLRVLAESLKALTTMTRAGQLTELCPEVALVSSVESLVKVLRSLHAAEGSSSNTAIRLNALFLLVNFASSDQCRNRMAHCGALEALLEIIQSSEGGGATQDDQLVQLALLGVALMTTGGVSDAAAVVELSTAVNTLVRLLSSKSASIQANAVWVVSNISSQASLKDAIVARGGPTALQAMLNDNMSTMDSAAARNGIIPPQRPSSSTMRIREYAPKAIKALGFAPIMPPST